MKHFHDIVEIRWSRRSVLSGVGAWLAASTGMGCSSKEGDPSAHPASGDAGLAVDAPLVFQEVPGASDESLEVPAGFRADVICRWGDPLWADAPAFDPYQQTGQAQARQWGTNNDFLGLLPLEPVAGRERVVLVANHEYCSVAMMHPEPRHPDGPIGDQQAAVEMSAHGMSVVVLERSEGLWERVDSELTRRITAHTSMKLSGPVKGHRRVRTAADPNGEQVLGTLHNCSGTVTPWGTVLSGEENFRYSFRFVDEPGKPEGENHRAFRLAADPLYPWDRIEPRFDTDKHPNEPNRFGWIVEVDPFDPTSEPVKRTALGRFAHEGAALTMTPDGRAVLYMGDDAREQCLYRFVSDAPGGEGAATKSLLDSGTLSAARFEPDGTAKWIPLMHGVGPLVGENGFQDQGDVLIDARRAAHLVGATPMDRPERIEFHPLTGEAYVMLTNNRKRKNADAANPRAPNEDGHIVVIAPGRSSAGDADHTADVFRWDLFLLAGRQALPPEFADMGFASETTEDGRFRGPDNCVFDPGGRLWVCTDADDNEVHGNGVFVVETDTQQGAYARRFLRAPIGAEVTGPCFSADGTTLFVSIQHPGSAGDKPCFERPACRWPDYDDQLPPRSSVVAITREDGKPFVPPWS